MRPARVVSTAFDMVNSLCLASLSKAMFALMNASNNGKVAKAKPISNNFKNELG
jgi:hypothetical protein